MAINSALGLAAGVRDEAHYAELLSFVDDCFDRGRTDDSHPVFSLVDLVAVRIRDYEDRVHPWPNKSTAVRVLANLMRGHGLKQTDLPEVGSQGLVSEVLAGRPVARADLLQRVAQPSYSRQQQFHAFNFPSGILPPTACVEPPRSEAHTPSSANTFPPRWQQLSAA